jgi:hypothetical protein
LVIYPVIIQNISPKVKSGSSNLFDSEELVCRSCESSFLYNVDRLIDVLSMSSHKSIRMLLNLFLLYVSYIRSFYLSWSDALWWL